MAYATYRSAIDNINIYLSIEWLLGEQKKLNSTKPDKNNHKYYIIIPVLREQEIISQTFKNFAAIKGNYSLIFITTQKEDIDAVEIKKKLVKIRSNLLSQVSLDGFQELTTGIFTRSESKKLFDNLCGIGNLNRKWDIVLDTYNNKEHTRDIIKKLIEENNHVNVHIWDYPHQTGAMAHQLNYICQKIIKTNDPSKTFVLIYNADSQVSDDLILSIEKFHSLYHNANVVQQSSLFFTNFNFFQKTFTGKMLKSIALLQSRWTLTHELPRIISQSKTLCGNLTEGSHVVGHGLCIRLDCLKKVGMFPTSYINEDMPLGYLLRLNGERIFPFPILENSESPNTIKSMFTQYRTWFYGVMYYPLYMYQALKNKAYSRLKIILWGIKYTIRAIIWLLSSFVWLFLLMYPFFSHRYDLLLIAVSIFVIYAPLSFFILKTLVNRHLDTVFNRRYKRIEVDMQTYLLSFVAYLTHSLGPVFALYDYFKKLISGNQIVKNKTER